MSVVVICGQTDSGKSTLVGRILYETGWFKQKEAIDDGHKIPHGFDEDSRPSKWSALVDVISGEIEGNKSKTQICSTFTITNNDRQFFLIDTPGHLIYIRSLVEQMFAQPVDAVCLAVSAIKNEFDESFDKGTSKEDLLIARSAGCATLIVVFTKCDKVENILDSQVSRVKKLAEDLEYKTIHVVKTSAIKDLSPQNFLDLVPNPSIKKPLGKTIKTNKFDTISKLFIRTRDSNLKAMISKGFKCMIHCLDGEYFCEIINMTDFKSDTEVIVIRNSNMIKISFVIIGDSQIMVSVGQKFLIRDANTTLGFGVFQG